MTKAVSPDVQFNSIMMTIDFRLTPFGSFSMQTNDLRYQSGNTGLLRLPL